MNKLKILYLTTSLDTYGPARALLNIATHLSPDRFDVVFCQCNGQAHGPIQDALRARAIPLHTLRATGPFDARTVYRLVKLLRAEAVQAVHTRLIRADFYGRLAGRLARIPLILTNLVDVYSQHFGAWHGAGRGRLLYAADRATLGLAHLIVANSEGVKNDLITKVGIPASKVRRIYNGVDTLLYAPRPEARPRVRRQIGLSADHLVMGTVARLYPKKGVSTLLEAAAGLRSRIPGLRLLIVGDGPERQRLSEQAAALGLHDQVVFLGERTDVPDLLAAMDIFAFPSLFEGFPNAVLEAMAAGLPVVATDIPGTNEVVQDGITGYLVPVDDPKAFAAKLVILAAEPTRRLAFGTAGRQAVIERFSLGHVARQFETLYTQHLTAAARRLTPERQDHVPSA
jgi:glycosyltransferase involved in cell wall biosynthesis